MALGLHGGSDRLIRTDERDGEPVKIPRSVRLACKALAEGYMDYHGPTEEEADAARQKAKKEKRKKKA